MIIDCDDCRMQHTEACRDCVVSFVLNDLAGPLELDEESSPPESPLRNTEGCLRSFCLWRGQADTGPSRHLPLQ